MALRGRSCDGGAAGAGAALNGSAEPTNKQTASSASASWLRRGSAAAAASSRGRPATANQLRNVYLAALAFIAAWLLVASPGAAVPGAAFLLPSASAADPAMCTNLNALLAASLARPVDGVVQFPLLTDASWLAADSGCATVSGDSLSYNSGSIAVDANSVALQLGGLALSNAQTAGSVAGVTVTRSLTASVAAGGAYSASATVEAHLLLSSTANAVPFENLAVTISIACGLAAAPLPAGAVAHTEVPCTVTLTTDAPTTVNIRDGNARDGQSAAIFYPNPNALNPQQVASLLQDANTLQSRFANTVLLGGPIALLPSTLADTTIRSAFMDANKLPALAEQQTGVDIQTGTLQQGSTQLAFGLLIQAEHECHDADCVAQSSVLWPWLSAFMRQQAFNQPETDAAVQACLASIASNDQDLISLYSRTTLDLFVSSGAIVPRSVSTYTQIVLECADAQKQASGTLVLTLGNDAVFDSTSLPWSRGLYLPSNPQQPEDGRIAAAMTKSLSTTPYGTLRGAISTPSQLYTFLPGNLFGSQVSGLAVADFDLSAAMPKITAAFAQLQAALNSDYPALNAAVAALISSSALAAQRTAYVAHAPQPTMNGFMAWLGEHVHGLSLSAIPATDDAGAFSVRLTAAASQDLDGSQLALTQLNAVLAHQLSGLIVAYDSLAASQLVPNATRENSVGHLSGLLSATATVRHVQSGSPVVTLTSPLSVAVHQTINSFFGYNNDDLLYQNVTFQISLAAPATKFHVEALAVIPVDEIAISYLRVALDSDSPTELLVDAVWDSAFVSLLQSQCQQMSASIQEDPSMNKALQPLNVPLQTVSPTVNWKTVLSTLCSSISTFNGDSNFDAATHIVQSIQALSVNSDVSTLGVHLAIATVSSSPQIRVRFHLHGLYQQTGLVSDSIWGFKTAFDRIQVPLLMASELQFVVTPAIATSATFLFCGQTIVDSFALPVASGMFSGSSVVAASTATTTTSARFAIDINLPNAATMDMELYVAPGLLSNLTALLGNNLDMTSSPLIHAVFSATNIGMDDAASNFFVDDVAFAIEPELAMGLYLDGSLQAPVEMMAGVFNVRSTAFVINTTFASISQEQQYVSNVAPWVASFDTTAPLAILPTTCASVLAETPELTINFTLNNGGAFVTCVIGNLDAAQNLNDVVSRMNAGLASCMPLIELRVVESDLAALDCGMLAVYSAMPGAIWQLESVQEPSDANLTLAMYWQLPSAPSFASWTDMSWLVRTVLGQAATPTFVLPTIQLVTEDELDFIPDEMEDVFPTAFPVMSFPILHQSSESLSAPPVINTLTTGDGMVRLDLDDDSVEAGTTVQLVYTTDGTFGAVFGGPPPTGSIFINSNLTTDQSVNDPVPAAPNNTLGVAVSSQLRQRMSDGSLQVSTETLSFNLVLTPGESTFTALFNAIASAVTGTIFAPVLNATIAAGRPSLNISDQLSIELVQASITPPTSGATVAWLLPLSIQITASTLPAFGTTRIAVATTRCVLGNLNIHTTAGVQSAVPASAGVSVAQGYVGVVDTTASSLAAQSQSDFDLVFPGFASAQFVTSALRQKNATFTQYVATFAVATAADVSTLSFSTTESPFPSDASHLLRFGMNVAKTTLFSVQDLTDLLSNLAFEVTTQGQADFTSAMQTLAATSPVTTLCNLVNEATTMFEDVIAKDPRLAQLLPFLEKTLASYAGDAFLQQFQTIVDNLCHRQAGLATTLATYDSVSDAAFATDVASAGKLSGTELHFQFDLKLYHHTFKTSFRFDANTLLKNPGAPLPIGIGSSGDFSVDVNVGAHIDFFIDFKNFVPSLRIGQDTNLTLAVNLDSTAILRAWLGPISVTFGNANVAIGTPLLLTVAVDGVSLVGNARMSAALTVPSQPICAFTVTIADISAFLQDPSNPNVVFLQDCPDQAVGALELAMLDASFLHLLLESRHVRDLINMFVGGFLAEDLLGFNGLNTDLTLPVIGTSLQKFVVKELMDIAGTDFIKEFTIAITHFTQNIIHEIEQDIEQLALKEFTEIICHAWRNIMLGPCPAVPKPSDKPMTWDFHLGRVYSEPVVNLTWDLGANRPASFEVQCMEELVMEWQFNFRMTFDTRQGLQFSLPFTPVFKADTTLSFENPCSMTGKLFVVEADLQMTGGLTAQVYLNPPATAGGPYVGDFGLDAQLNAAAVVGLAGIFSGETVTSLPNWEVDMSIVVDVSKEHLDFTPNITFSNGKFCVGSVIQHMLAGVVQEAQHALGPVNKILGPSSILRRKIPATKYLFGRELVVIEMLDVLARLFCPRDCIFSNVFEAIEAFMTIDDQLNAFLNIVEQIDCTSHIDLGHFSVDFHADYPDPWFFLPMPDFNDIIFDDPDSHERDSVVNAWASVTTQGQFQVTCPACHNPVKFLISAILGKNEPIILIQIPEMLVSLGFSYRFFVWAAPPVHVSVGISASLTVAVPPIQFDTYCITAAVVSRKASELFTHMELQLYDANHNLRWPLRASVTLTGGVGVNVFIFKGGVSVSITLEGMMRFPDVNGDGLITFDQVFAMVKQNGLMESTVTELDLIGGFNLYIEACIHFPWGHKHCWHIVNVNLHDRLWGETINPKNVGAVADDSGAILLNNINLAATSGAYTIMLYQMPTEIRVSGADDAEPRSLTRPLSLTTSLISLAGQLDSSIHLTFDIRTIGSLIQFPSTPSSVVRMHMDSYAVGSVGPANAPGGGLAVSISPSRVVAGSTSGVQLLGECGTLDMQDPVSFSTVNIAGLGCANTLLATLNTNVTMVGTPSQYAVGPVTISGWTQTLQLQVSEVAWTLEDNTVTGAQNTRVILDADAEVGLVNVIASSADTTFTINSVPQGRSVVCMGAEGNDVFVIPDISKLTGDLSVNGGANMANRLHSTHYATPGQPLNIVATPFMLTQTNGVADAAVNISMAMTLIQELYFDLHGASNAAVTYSLTGMNLGTFVAVNSIGTLGASMTININDCDAGSAGHVNLTSDGDHTVVFGVNGLISGHCTFYVYGSSSPDSVSTVIFNAPLDGRQLVWQFKAQTATVYDPSNPATNVFQIIFESVDRMLVNLGNGTTDVTVYQGTYPTELVIAFPEVPSASGVTSSFTVMSSAQVSMLVTGIYQLAIVGSESRQMNTPPLDLFVNQFYLMNDMCISRTDTNGVPYNISTPPTAWMCDQMVAAGFDASACSRPCPVLFLSDRGMAFDIVTGSGEDLFIADQVQVPHSVSLQQGDDRLVVISPTMTATPTSYSLGANEDSALVYTCDHDAPAMSLDFGDDSFADELQLFLSPDRNAHVNASTVGPLGPNAAVDVLTLLELHSADRIIVKPCALFPSSSVGHAVIRAPRLKTTATAAAAAAAAVNDPTVIDLSMPVIGQRLTVYATSDTVYNLQQAAEGTILTFNAIAQPTLPAPLNWTLNVVVPQLFLSNQVDVFGVAGQDATFTLNVPADNTQHNVHLYQPSQPWQEQFATISVDGMRITLRGVDHTAVTVTDPARGSIFDIQGNPCNGDLLLQAPTNETQYFFNGPITNDVLVLGGGTPMADFSQQLPSGFILAFVGDKIDIPLQNLSFATQVSLVQGCLRTANPVTPPGPTAVTWWLAQAMAPHVDPAAASGCAAFFYDINTARFQTRASGVLLSGIEHTTKLIQVTGAQTLDLLATDVPWTQATLTSSSLLVADYQLLVDQGTRVAVTANDNIFLLNGTSQLTFNCPVIAAVTTSFEFGPTSNSTPALTWSTQACRGAVSADAHGSYFPSLTIGQQVASVELEVDLVSPTGQAVHRTASIDHTQIDFTSSDGRGMKLSWPASAASAVRYHLQFDDGTNDVAFAQSLTTAGASLRSGGFGSNAKGTLKFDPNSAITMGPGSSRPTCDATYRSVTPRSGSDSFCLWPRQHCQAASWTDVAVSESCVFDQLEDACHSAVIATWRAPWNIPFDCFPDPAVKPAIVLHVPAIDAANTDDFSNLKAWRGLSVTGLVIGVAIALLSFGLYGVAILEPIFAYALTSSFWKTDSDAGDWSLTARKLVQVINVTISGWTANNAPGTVLDAIVALLAIFTVLSAVCEFVASRSDETARITSWLRVCKRMLVATMLFVLIPVFVFSASSDRIDSAAGGFSIFFFVVAWIWIGVSAFQFVRPLSSLKTNGAEAQPFAGGSGRGPQEPATRAEVFFRVLVPTVMAILILGACVLAHPEYEVTASEFGATSIVLLVLSSLCSAINCWIVARTASDRVRRALLVALVLALIFGVSLVAVVMNIENVSGGSVVALWIFWALLWPILLIVILSYVHFKSGATGYSTYSTVDQPTMHDIEIEHRGGANDRHSGNNYGEIPSSSSDHGSGKAAEDDDHVENPFGRS
ncbi:hypothetical protein CAOG_08011 [Capsaspora owczarzaki ATCC 30864]|uniref:Uncharacterized protein n=1 Tax=Capsaspora owczarzaki (strain ATCC 30864) TaxID=595528 RepID=A0A0D2WXJ9_CAPO3|nr:hypothetical protein CAOG_08011 [Capsaspora owczarzaki ATCC 30864]KJE97945.1 hypothetical protein CAOG_008011 [Capsaspora owczarzaki ATCC 30864]|eukprot:XP_004342612.1 hypothetical protein CAOG_08011 [Capsaspora owczarzaki ATCC 30864]